MVTASQLAKVHICNYCEMTEAMKTEYYEDSFTKSILASLLLRLRVLQTW